MNDHWYAVVSIPYKRVINYVLISYLADHMMFQSPISGS